MKSRNYLQSDIENRNTINLPKGPNYGSTYRVESDQKDIIIGKLKAQSGNLTKNQQQFKTLKQEYAELQRKYRILQQQKSLQDNDFKNRHQSSIRYICQLKNELEAMKAQLRDKRIQIGDLQSQFTAFSNGLDEKNIELDKNRAEINSQRADGDELQRQRLAFVQQSQKISKTNLSLRAQLQDMQCQNAQVDMRLAEMQKYLEQLEIQADLLKKKLQEYEQNNNSLDHEIQQVIQDINSLQNQIQQSQSEIIAYQTANAEMANNVEKYRSEAIHLQKSTQNELMKNNDTTKSLKQAENILKVRQSQVQQGRTEIDALKNENENLQKINSQLVDDLQACRRHLEDLGILNKQLLTHMQGFSEEDEQVRQLIDRKSKVKYARQRATQTSALNYEFGKYTQRTDIPSSSRRTYRP